ncbi:hypothetical protein MPTK1_1g29230 [Marchantia polymorpha subsp. ruderalis]|uniref:Uncharacterized protein n=2 Tax=Marchantia polymorpha TaxID=3197 RepID=A0AAF6AVH2_MARPO|nr:hypothetical protein MARPO_0107s0038 [Marchantia polymorpha]BBN00443.1 hypothetical protein Mp_1g29230 [Marchantia polymorpha subsp. ruderalis]|eukprot:PTQ31771.1 hypothetical protein MARPO_0107s0038 [Marchantia polymorpha]
MLVVYSRQSVPSVRTVSPPPAPSACLAPCRWEAPGLPYLPPRSLSSSLSLVLARSLSLSRRRPSSLLCCYRRCSSGRSSTLVVRRPPARPPASSRCCDGQQQQRRRRRRLSLLAPAVPSRATSRTSEQVNVRPPLAALAPSPAGSRRGVDREIDPSRSELEPPTAAKATKTRVGGCPSPARAGGWSFVGSKVGRGFDNWCDLEPSWGRGGGGGGWG